MEALPKINVKEIQKVMDWLDFKQGIGDEPAHYQSNWMLSVEEMVDSYRTNFIAELGIEDEDWCGTACCVAGYVALPYINRPSGASLVTKPYETPDGTVIDPKRVDMMGEPISLAGRKILGLTDEEKDEIFDGEASVERIRDGFNAALERRGEAVRV